MLHCYHGISFVIIADLVLVVLEDWVELTMVMVVPPLLRWVGVDEEGKDTKRSFMLSTDVFIYQVNSLQYGQINNYTHTHNTLTCDVLLVNPHKD